MKILPESLKQIYYGLFGSSAEALAEHYAGM